jgi:hypothetical protein
MVNEERPDRVAAAYSPPASGGCPGRETNAGVRCRSEEQRATMRGKKASEEARRKQILKAAYEVASREGIGGLTLRAIAAEARLSHGFAHFHLKRFRRANRRSLRA